VFGKNGGPDAAFSMEPKEFKQMVASIRNVEKALGKVTYELTDSVRTNRIFSRSLFVVQDMKKGEVFCKKNVRSIRPGIGLSPGFYNDILGKKAAKDILKGEPLFWNLIM